MWLSYLCGTSPTPPLTASRIATADLIVEFTTGFAS